MTAEFHARSVQIFRPYPDEAPWSLLAIAGLDEAALEDRLTHDQTRIAKFEARLVGAYGLRPMDDVRFELVALAVVEGYRRRGLGRWLLGHALGLAESRGGREVVTAGCPGGPSAAARRLLTGVGFVADGKRMRLELTPE
jgi:GNAT superfamily N-acetyltransferase